MHTFLTFCMKRVDILEKQNKKKQTFSLIQSHNKPTHCFLSLLPQKNGREMKPASLILRNVCIYLLIFNKNNYSLLLRQLQVLPEYRGY